MPFFLISCEPDRITNPQSTVARRGQEFKSDSAHGQVRLLSLIFVAVEIKANQTNNVSMCNIWFYMLLAFLLLEFSPLRFGALVIYTTGCHHICFGFTCDRVQMTGYSRLSQSHGAIQGNFSAHSRCVGMCICM